MLDQHTVGADLKQLDPSELIAFLDQAGLAVGRAKKGYFPGNANESHRQGPHHGAQHFALRDAINACLNERREVRSFVYYWGSPGYNSCLGLSGCLQRSGICFLLSGRLLRECVGRRFF